MINGEEENSKEGREESDEEASTEEEGLEDTTQKTRYDTKTDWLPLQVGLSEVWFDGARGILQHEKTSTTRRRNDGLEVDAV